MLDVNFTLAGTRPIPVPPHPVALTSKEALRIAGILPILFRQQSEEWEAVCLLDNASLKHPAIDLLGHWRLNYIPTLIRLRPFVFRKGGEIISSWDLDMGSILLSKLYGSPFIDKSSGMPSSEFLGVITELEKVRTEFSEMSNLIGELASVSLIEPVDSVFKFLAPVDRPNLFAINANRLVALPTSKLGELARGHLSSLEVALATIFSMRWANGAFLGAKNISLDDQLEALGNSLKTPEQKSEVASPHPTPSNNPLPSRQTPQVQYSVDDDIILDFEGL